MQIRANNISVKYGEFTALSDLSFATESAAVNAVIGPNGAGKTTLLNVLSGLQEPASGAVALDGREIVPWRPRTLWHLGVSRTFQIPRLFDHMSVTDNVGVGIRTEARDVGPWRLKRVTREAKMWLERLGGESLAQKKIKDLTFPEQRLVELARALACQPTLLLLDEPSAGIAIDDARRLMELAIAHLPTDASIVLVSHDVPLVFELAKHIVVLEFGHCIAEGSPEYIGSHPLVRTAYLGESIAEAEEEVVQQNGPSAAT